MVRHDRSTGLQGVLTHLARTKDRPVDPAGRGKSEPSPRGWPWDLERSSPRTRRRLHAGNQAELVRPMVYVAAKLVERVERSARRT